MLRFERKGSIFNNMNMYPQKSLIGKVEKSIRESGLILPNEKIVVAVSGGADSICMLDVLDKLKNKLNIQLSAAHFNHLLRGAESDHDEKFVQEFCQKRGLDLIIGRSPSKKLYKNEEQARAGRYAFFEKIIGEGRGDKICLAHNKNDLAETTLFRVIRGTGIRGLRSIPSVRKKFIRPLLQISRFKIEQYMHDNSLPFCIDSSNNDLQYSRNRIRHKILPLLSELNPGIVDALSVLSSNLSLDYDYIEQQSTQVLNGILEKKDENCLVISRSAWMELHPALRAQVLRTAIADLANLENLTYKQLQEVLALIIKNEGNKKKRLPHSLQIELQAGKIILSKNKLLGASI